ncbi:hypothetical protein [Roseomonas xinghualingensis]|uniref:hypothetical protein n=1 Tax=Roseomonas xinghualingensis TaxID=2986475 RepID=UPI0021F22225|nr:hypothetical protein [Roseomonas sp. SXEYE001]MCV4206631.1 hypothetical protein [Roseomonas sp. SXEYE001]
MHPVTLPAQHGPALAALLFRPGPHLPPEAHRVAHALLQDAARNRGGRVSSAADGTWRLEATPPALEHARRALAAVLNGRDAVLVTEAVAAPPVPERPGTGPEAILAAKPLHSLLERRPILGFGSGGIPRPAGLRLLPSAPAIAAALGTAWEGSPWQAHGWEVVARRALASPHPAETPLHLDLPPEALPLVKGAALLPVLPPRILARPPIRPFAVAGLTAAHLAILDPAHLPGTAIHLNHDPALEALPPAFWRALKPARVVLEGVADAAGLEWGLSRGIARFTGPQADRLLDVLRRNGGT